MAIIGGGELYNGISRGNVFRGAGAPVNNTTLVGVAEIGDLYTDKTNGKLYIVTATNGSTTITFTVVGTQT